VTCTDGTAPKTVREHLANSVARTGSQPTGTSLGHELTGAELNALNVVLGHLRRRWPVASGGSDEQLRQFLRALRVVSIDADDGGPDHAAAVATLATALPTMADAAGSRVRDG
jgi:hypothetical protein